MGSIIYSYSRVTTMKDFKFEKGYVKADIIYFDDPDATPKAVISIENAGLDVSKKDGIILDKNTRRAIKKSLKHLVREKVIQAKARDYFHVPLTPPCETEILSVPTVVDVGESKQVLMMFATGRYKSYHEAAYTDSLMEERTPKKPTVAVEFVGKAAPYNTALQNTMQRSVRRLKASARSYPAFFGAGLYRSHLARKKLAVLKKADYLGCKV